MIPVEYLWLALIVIFGIIGMTRGLSKELGVTTVLLLSLFALNLGWKMVGADIVAVLPDGAPDKTVMAAYYAISILFIAFIAYEGVTIKFPAKETNGIMKAIGGLLGGLPNGYLIVGTIWDVVNQASYFGFEVPVGTTGTTAEISRVLTDLNNTLVKYLPVSLMDSSDVTPYIFIALGMILLLAIILK